MKSENPHYSLVNYRSDIDGLRALAVIAVILYHAFPKLIRGGFVGVDIFFVISGYLIGSILFKNFYTNNFCIYTFYARRIKRIFPALILVLIFCLSLGWFSLTDIEYTMLSKHAMASTYFYTNFALAKESGYFDISSHLKPLMHLWSLAVEEQFYIFCPLLLYFAIKKRWNILSLCLAVILLSFLVSIKTLHTDPVKAFFYPLCRTWELTTGVLLAYLTYIEVTIPEKIKERINYWLNTALYKPGSTNSQQTLVEMASFLGLSINLYSIFFLKKTNHFPGWQAILPVVGTLLILAAGKNTWINKKILSNKIAVWIGLISYPLYLWHWSLLSFALIFEGHLYRYITITILLISVLLAWISYKFIEKPIRSAKDSKFIPLVLVSLLILVGLGAYNIVANRGYNSRKAHVVNYFPPLPNYDKRFIDLQILGSSPLDKPIKKDTIDYPIDCVTNSDKPQFLVMGDSHALSFSYSAAINHDFNLAMLYGPMSISYILHSESLSEREDRIKNRKLFNNYLNNILTTYHSIEYVVLIGRGARLATGTGFGIETKNAPTTKWLYENIYDSSKKLLTSKEFFVAAYTEMIEFLISKGKKVIFVVDYPELGENPQLCFKRSFNLSPKPANDCVLERKVVDARQAEYRVLIQQIKQHFPSLLVYDSLGAFCDKNKCYGKKNGTIYYWDDNHLNLEGSQLLINDFKNWLLKENISIKK